MFVKMTIILLLKIAYAQLNEKPCSKTFGIKDISTTKIDTKTENISGEKISIEPQTIKIFAVRVTKKTLLCKDNFLATFGAQCKSNSRVITYDREKLEEMRIREKCFVGRECKTNECSGGLSNLCETDILDRYIDKRDSRQLIKETKDWYYTCQISWKCEIGVYKQTPAPKTQPTSHWFRGMTGKDIELKPGTTTYSIDGFQYLTQEFRTTREKMTMGCITRKKGSICMYNNNPPQYAMIDESGYGVDMSTLIKVNTTGFSGLTKINALDVSNQAGLIHITNELMEDSYQNRYNILSLASSISKLTSALTVIIQEGGIQPAMAKLLKLGTGQLKWEGRNSYRFCPTTFSKREIPPEKTYQLFNDPHIVLNEIYGDLPIDQRERAQSEIEMMREAENLDHNDNDFGEQRSGSGWISGLVYDTFLHLFFTVGSCLGYVSIVIMLIRR